MDKEVYAWEHFVFNPVLLQLKSSYAGSHFAAESQNTVNATFNGLHLAVTLINLEQFLNFYLHITRS